MRIKVNDRDIDFDRSTVQHLIDHLKLNPGSIVVEKNEIIVSRDDYVKEEIKEGDILEIVRFVGGG